MIKLPETSDATFSSMLEFGKAMGKTAVSAKVIQIHSQKDVLRNDAQISSLILFRIQF